MPEMKNYNQPPEEGLCLCSQISCDLCRMAEFFFIDFSSFSPGGALSFEVRLSLV